MDKHPIQGGGGGVALNTLSYFMLQKPGQAPVMWASCGSTVPYHLGLIHSFPPALDYSFKYSCVAYAFLVIVSDACQDKPCQNGATCVKLNDDFKCTCAAGFTGKTCSSKQNCF